MVHPKAKSGDPDYDDKVPAEQHAGGLVVSAGDGVILSKVNGPVDADGAHVNLAVDETDLDNRPAPGDVATEPSEVQQYSVEDTPAYGKDVEADHKDIEIIKSGQASVHAAHEANVRGEEPGQADEANTRSGDISAAAGSDKATAAPATKRTTSANK